MGHPAKEDRISQAQCLQPAEQDPPGASKRTTTQKQGTSLLTTGQCDSVEGNDVFSPLHCITSCTGFKLACINANSLCKHIDEIRYNLLNSPLEVLAINESKHDDTISDTEVYIPGYVTIRNRSGGGVALCIRENLSYTNRIDLVPDTLEMIRVEINLPHSRSFLVSIWYRPPCAEMQLFDEYEKFFPAL